MSAETSARRLVGIRSARSPSITDGAYRDQVRSYHAAETFQKAMHTRQARVAPLFSPRKNWYGLRRFHRRGLATVTIEALPIAARQNLERLLSRS